MEEEKQDIKKPSLIRRIFRWIGLGLLSILLVIALVFQAPWKVTTLLIIILLACTALPKTYRKLFWLSGLAILIALVIWVFLPEDSSDWKTYTFDQDIAALQAKHAVPDSENAAIIYTQLLKAENENDESEPNIVYDYNSPLHDPRPWSSKDHPELAEWLKTEQDTITALIQASKIEKCWFPITAYDILDMDEAMDILPSMRYWARSLITAGNNDIAENRTEAALEKLLCTVQMGHQLCQQPSLIHALVGIAIEDLAAESLKNFVVTGNVTEKQLDVIERVLAKVKPDLKTSFFYDREIDKLMIKHLLVIFYEVNPAGKTRLSHNLIAKITQYQDPSPELRYWLNKLSRVITIFNWFYLPSNPKEIGKTFDAVFDKYYMSIEPNFTWQKKPEALPLTSKKLNYSYMIDVLVDMLDDTRQLPYHEFHDLQLQTKAKQRGALLTIALRRYNDKIGRWPETLDEVKPLAPAEIFVDPTNGDSFAYKLTEENFTLYSKGKNNIDEEGLYNSTLDPNTYTQQVQEDDRLIWPIKRTSKKEETDGE